MKTQIVMRWQHWLFWIGVIAVTITAVGWPFRLWRATRPHAALIGAGASLGFWLYCAALYDGPGQFVGPAFGMHVVATVIVVVFFGRLDARALRRAQAAEES